MRQGGLLVVDVRAYLPHQSVQLSDANAEPLSRGLAPLGVIERGQRR